MTDADDFTVFAAGPGGHLQPVRSEPETPIETVECGRCNGAGRVNAGSRHALGGDTTDIWLDCQDCSGRGRITVAQAVALRGGRAG